MSSFLTGTGGGRAYRLNIDLIKPPTTFSTSNSSSPSSTLSESRNSPLSIFSRKPRTPRKRPNQTYNEAATILSTAYPKLFPPKNLSKPFKFTKSHDDRTTFPPEPPGLFMPFDRVISSTACLLQCPPMLESSTSPTQTTADKPCFSPGEVSSKPQENFSEICDEHQEKFDAESFLDDGIEEGIDSIMGKLWMDGETIGDSNGYSSAQRESYCYGFPVGMGFDFGCGMRRESRAMRNIDDGNWWSFPLVNVADITHKIATMPVENKKKNNSSPHKQKKDNLADAAAANEEAVSQPTAKLQLKLNYDNVLNAWSGKGSPFSGDSPVAESAGNNVQARLAQIELFPEKRGARGAVVLRYEEKRRMHLFSEMIRYRVRKLNCDQRHRIKGRFGRTADDD